MLSTLSFDIPPTWHNIVGNAHPALATPHVRFSGWRALIRTGLSSGETYSMPLVQSPSDVGVLPVVLHISNAADRASLHHERFFAAQRNRNDVIDRRARPAWAYLRTTTPSRSQHTVYHQHKISHQPVVAMTFVLMSYYAGTKFDIDYYVKKHMPMVES